jgi:hypothetical protein
MTAILKVDTIQDTSGNNIINENAGTITIGKSGDTVNLASGATNNLGITEADQWRLTAAKDSDGDITANLERNDTDSAYIGTGMTESSGIFTFPSTGLYWIVVNARIVNGADDNQFNVNIFVTTDNSTYTNRGVLSAGDNEAGETRTSVAQNIFFNVTNTTTHKVKFNINSLGSGFVSGQTDQNDTTFTFIRLGDST